MTLLPKTWEEATGSSEILKSPRSNAICWHRTLTSVERPQLCQSLRRLPRPQQPRISKLSFKKFDACDGVSFATFIVENVGSVPFRSAYIKVTNQRIGKSVEQGLNAFDLRAGCVLAKNIAPLDPGGTGYLSQSAVQMVRAWRKTAGSHHGLYRKEPERYLRYADCRYKRVKRRNNRQHRRDTANSECSSCRVPASLLEDLCRPLNSLNLFLKGNRVTSFIWSSSKSPISAWDCTSFRRAARTRNRRTRRMRSITW